MSNADDWHRVEAAFHEVLELSDAEANQRLQELFGNEPELLEDALSLLKSVEKTEDFLETTAMDRFASFLDKESVDLDAPLKLEGFDLKHPLGRGGMGQVFVAEQHQPRRKVALKLIRRGVDKREHFYRFMAELQALALMNHMNIAQVFEAGTTNNGIPYFTMEYVEGSPITSYCDEKRLTIAQRLNLFHQVCLAIAHAHQKGVIHRDLKPSNILVKVQNQQPVPKVIDFGIAKVFEIEGEDWRKETIEGAVIGTPAYMSPEQADSARDIDTRSDVYALGILLYELLIGTLPLEDQAYENKALSEVLKVIRETKAPRLHQRFKSMGAACNKIASLRQTTEKELAKLWHSDLQRIVSKALELDREKRYNTVVELGDDIIRFLNNEPISARSQTMGYIISKYVKRHRRKLMVQVPLVSVVTMGLLFLLYSLNLNIQRARDATNHIQSITRTLESSLEENNLNFKKRIDNQASMLLDVVDGLRTDLVPAAEMASLHHEFSRYYAALGNYAMALPQSERAVNLYRELLPEDDPERLAAEHTYALHLYNRDEPEKAKALLEIIISHRSQLLGPQAGPTLDSRRALADALSKLGESDRARDIYIKVLEFEEETFGPGAMQTCITRHNLAKLYAGLSKYQLARPLYKKNYEYRRQANGLANLDTINSQIGYARALIYTDGLQEGLQLAKEAINLSEKNVGNYSEQSAFAYFTFGIGLSKQNNYQEAASAFERAQDIFADLNGLEDSDTLINMNNLSDVYIRLGKFEKALQIKLLEQETRQKMGIENSTESIECLSNLGEIYNGLGDYEKGNAHFKDLLQRLKTYHPDRKGLYAFIMGLKAASSRGLGQNEQAEKELAEGLEGTVDFPGYYQHIQQVNGID